MYRKLPLKTALALAVLALSSGLAMADTVSESDAAGANDTLATAQPLSTSNGEVIVPAVLTNNGKPAGDLDFFSFHAEAGNEITFDIDNGDGDASSVDTWMGIFGPDGKRIVFNDDGNPIDAGSLSVKDSRICAGQALPSCKSDGSEKFIVPATGTYVVGVTNYRSMGIGDGGVVYSKKAAYGDYTLVIAGLPVATTQVDVVAKAMPGMIGKLNAKNQGNVWAAILSSSTFNALEVNKTSLTFGVTGDENSLRSCKRKLRDVNGDGQADLVCRFVFASTGIAADKLDVVLKGKTLDGQDFQGKTTLVLKSKHAERHHSDHEHDDEDDGDEGENRRVTHRR